MPTHKSTIKCKYIETKIDDPEAIITRQSCKQTKRANKQTKNQTTETDYATSKCVYA